MRLVPTLAAALIPLAAIAAPATPALGATDAGLAQVEASLAATQTMTAHFVQTDGKGRQLDGQFSLKRPGRIRFDYGRAANMLVVSDGQRLNFLDYSAPQMSSWPIDKTPLKPLLAANPDLGRIARILPTPDPRVLLLRARDARHPEFGTLILAFVKAPGAPAGLRMEGWTAIDALNKKTSVKLDDQRYNVAVADSAFTFTPIRKK